MRGSSATKPAAIVTLLGALASSVLLTACGFDAQRHVARYPDPAGGTIHLRPGVHPRPDRLCNAFREQVVPHARGEGDSYSSVGRENDAAVAVLGHALEPWSGLPPRTPLAICYFSADRIDDLAGLRVIGGRGHFGGAAVVDWHGRWTPDLVTQPGD